MSGVRIYMEGGGDSKEGKAPLRTGMDTFLASLKVRAREKRWTWKLIPCGGRNETYDAFENATEQYPDEFVFLLVDAEEAVSMAPLAHLKKREEWTFTRIDGNHVHLMALTMEAWIVADPEKLGEFYRQGFAANALPKAPNLETVSKEDLNRALTKATEKTNKGEYHKINHASQLLQRIRPDLVRNRCPHCELMFKKLDALLTQ